MQIEDIVTKADLDAFEKRIMAAITADRTKTEPCFLDLGATAKKYNLKKGKLSELVRTGEIAHSKFGRKIFIDTNDMDAYFRKNRIMSDDEASSKAFARS
ncbi:Helix-turn-helix domain-containing protein [Fibrobacter sp. UWH9]|uniref:helix-turn-helix domain-containing protein n=1 Tax=Fibrobacter sp. UWH9 TaxID=1896213 RepID=UPI00091641AB|nr:helix-turn-helix domain-containing protein [Fibrobacter sp. UWH9]SHH26393.1 Helix-turn-helix domain-containing protein [Fibrobacter sp. UWH9]